MSTQIPSCLQTRMKRNLFVCLFSIFHVHLQSYCDLLSRVDSNIALVNRRNSVKVNQANGQYLSYCCQQEHKSLHASFIIKEIDSLYYI